MLKLEEIHELLKAVDQSNIQELEYENEGFKLSLKKGAATAPAAAPISYVSQPSVAAETVQLEAVPSGNKEVQGGAPERDTSGLHKISSPMVGTFYSSPSPDADSFVSVGSKVKADTVVCIVEAMKLMNEIEAEISGEIVEILVENGQLVEYGQDLFLVKPE